MSDFKSLIPGAASAGKVQIKKDGILIGTEKAVNLIEGLNVDLSVADDPGNEEVDVTVTASLSGGGIVSAPSSGEYQITNLRLAADKKIVVTYNDVPKP